MSSGITAMTFYILMLVTLTLQMTMYFKRAKFLKTLKGLSGLKTKSKGLGVQDLGTMMQIIFPVKLESVQDGQLKELRESATKVSAYWVISLLSTLTLPILMYKLLA